MKLFFRSYGGERERTDRPPLIILHGLFGSHDNWHTLSKRFGEQLTVFGLDMRNHGRSPHSDEMSYPAMAADVLEFLTDHNLKNVFLLGHSMGGKVAMQFAFSYPHRLEKLVVVDVAPKSYPPHHDTILDALVSLDTDGLTSRKEADEALARKIGSFSVRQFLIKNLARTESGSFQWKMNLDVIDRNYEELNRQPALKGTFDKQTLFVKGATSSYIADNDTPLIKKYFPSAEIVTLETGHWVHSEAPDVFARLVLSFLIGPQSPGSFIL